MGRPLDIDAVWLKIQYIDLRRSTYNIAKELGCTDCTVGNYLHKYGIPVRNTSESSTGRKFSDDAIAKISRSSLRSWKNPDYREKVSLGIRKRWGDPEYRKTASKVRVNSWDDERRGALSERMIQQWSDPCRRKNHSDKIKECWKDPEFRKSQTERMFGEGSPTWKGGISPERTTFYNSSVWKAAVKAVYARDNGICQRCGTKKYKSDGFHIHHLVTFEVVELRASVDNLVLLCPDCHWWVHSKENTNGDFILRLSSNSPMRTMSYASKILC